MAVLRVFITLKRLDLSWRGGLHSVVGSTPTLENCYCKGEFFFPLRWNPQISCCALTCFISPGTQIKTAHQALWMELIEGSFLGKSGILVRSLLLLALAWTRWSKPLGPGPCPYWSLSKDGKGSRIFWLNSCDGTPEI